MIVREVFPEEKDQFNKVVSHPIQSWEWGEFRKSTGVRAVRLGVFDRKELKNGYQVTIHSLPKVPYTLIYFPKGPMPDKVMLEALKKLGRQQKAILIKLEPNIGHPCHQQELNAHQTIENFLLNNGCQPGQPLFTKWTFQIGLEKTEEELLAEMKSKTRYNIKIAQKYQIEIVEDNSKKAFETYLKLTTETTKRQGFYAHTPEYHRKMWEILQPAGIAHLFLAKYKKRVLVAWILFVFNQILYYPYGASTRENQEVMASYAMMWEAMKFGKKMKCKTFDLWGSLGPNPDPDDPWFGFHRFKEGFGGQLIEFIGTYDLVINPQLYPFYNLANSLRWKFLRLKARIL